MISARKSWYASLILLAASCSVAADAPKSADTTESVLTAIAQKTATIKSFSADFTMTRYSGKRQLSARGRIESVLPDCSRMTIAAGQNSQTALSDGTTAWVLTPSAQRTERIDAQKVKAALQDAALSTHLEGHNIADPLAFIEPRTARLIATEKVQGHSCWVIEGRARLQNPSTLRVYVAQQTGTTRKTALLDAAGQTVVTILYDNLKLNLDLNPDLFRYTPPAGANVIDQTQRTIEMIRNMAASRKHAPTTEPAKSESGK